MRLAIFDLDHTLLAGDSDYLWGQYLVAQGVVTAEHYARENARFYADYQAGTLDIHAYARFALEPLVRLGAEPLLPLRERFVADVIAPIVAPAAPALLERHRMAGDTLIIITATSRFITEPIAELLDVDDLLATDPEMAGGRYTGRIRGVPCYQDGKRLRLEEWRATQRETYSHLTFYSDSHNDLPLLRRVHAPVAVDPDEMLRGEAVRAGWPVISLRDPPPSLD
ncbi:MAG TPA: HAD family hydrolase [Candidatus Binatia bacterium]|nr:HAD family hydrolase [Candidatus Binatia bacterium]